MIHSTPTAYSFDSINYLQWTKHDRQYHATGIVMHVPGTIMFLLYALVSIPLYNGVFNENKPTPSSHETRNMRDFCVSQLVLSDDMRANF